MQFHAATARDDVDGDELHAWSGNFQPLFFNQVHFVTLHLLGVLLDSPLLVTHLNDALRFGLVSLFVSQRHLHGWLMSTIRREGWK